MFFSKKNCNLLAALGCFALIAVAYFYMEKYLYLTPCPLCYAQRIVIGVIGAVFLLAALLPGQRVMNVVYGIILFVLSSGGAALSIRHLYLQSLPKGSSVSCGKDFYALFESSPFAEAVEAMVLGSGDCGEIQWAFLSLSIPAWTLMIFVGLALWGAVNNALRR